MYLTSVNQTTNEAGKWSDITRWYKKQKKKYNDAVKKGLVNPAENSTPTSPETPEVQDGDVTCTGSSNNQSTKRQEPLPQQQYFDPGPIPKNKYDRGFVENWKEVIFPMSLRMDALELGGFSRPTATPSESRPQVQGTNRPRPNPAPQKVSSNKTKST